jgi:hypothetical protein
MRHEIDSILFEPFERQDPRGIWAHFIDPLAVPHGLAAQLVIHHLPQEANFRETTNDSDRGEL